MNFSGFQHRWIDTTDPLYPEWVALRERTLREPLGLRFSPSDLAAEVSQLHLVLQSDSGIGGGLVVVPLGSRRWKIRQVVVDEPWRGRGLGRDLMKTAMSRAEEEHIGEIILHSRATVVGFYESLGFSVESPEFEEVGIPHRRMIFPLSSA